MGPASDRRSEALATSGEEFGPPDNVQTFDDEQALAGLSEVKVAFDITVGDGKGLLSRLNFIDETGGLHKYLVTVQPIAAGVGREPTKLEKQLYPIDCSTETYGLTAVVTCGYPV